MSTRMIAHGTPARKATPQGRFVAPHTDEQRKEFEQGKRAYRNGLSRYACSSDDMVAGWDFCQQHGERHGWMRGEDARGAQAYWLAMMQEASEAVN